MSTSPHPEPRTIAGLTRTISAASKAAALAWGIAGTRAENLSPEWPDAVRAAAIATERLRALFWEREAARWRELAIDAPDGTARAPWPRQPV